MADNYQFLEPTTAPTGTQLRTAKARELAGEELLTAVEIYAADGSPLLGRKAAAAALPVVLSTEDLAALQAVHPAAATSTRYVGLSTTGQVVKASAGTLRGYAVFNTSSSVRFVKIYNKGTVPTEGDIPALTIAVPAGGGANLDTAGIAFSAGISVRASTGVADNDTGAPGANEVIVQVWHV